mmetsp:Transcript_70079/g.127817  ORF Transcript_70079/g.127817 Transcript_70079/m.127817 type:complete len:430 (+) Transcript_70079:64-1353(+)
MDYGDRSQYESCSSQYESCSEVESVYSELCAQGDEYGDIPEKTKLMRKVNELKYWYGRRNSKKSWLWKVVGNPQRNGIIVRNARDWKSPAYVERLETGSIIYELDRGFEFNKADGIVFDRVKYLLIRGNGPQTGWVTTKLPHKDLLTPVDIPVASKATTVAIVIPFRPQPLQNRESQLSQLLKNFRDFLPKGGQDFVIIVVQQSDDRRLFNRGLLCNIGFMKAEEYASSKNHTLASVIFHDCDLLPPARLKKWYAMLPERGRPLHLFAPGLCDSSKYGIYERNESQPQFLGGIVALHPEDFRQCNGFPINLWGWGEEDAQLMFRLQEIGVTHFVFPPLNVGKFKDLDTNDVWQELVSNPEIAIKYFVEEARLNSLLEGGSTSVERDWRETGLVNTADSYEVVEHSHEAFCLVGSRHLTDKFGYTVELKG